MSETIEAQRAIIEGEYIGRPSGIFEVRARIIVPGTATILESSNARLALRGGWSREKGYTGFGLVPIPMGSENTFPLELQPDPEDDPNLVYSVRPRTIILEDQKVFGRYAADGWGPGDSDNALVAEYNKKYLVRDQPFDFEAMWVRVGAAN